MKSRNWHTLAAHGGSLRHTLVLLALLGAVALLRPQAAWLAAAVGLLALNLLAALVVHPVLRRQLPLLVAHLALLALVLGVAWGRLAALDGRFELTQGQAFDGRLIDGAAGPWYRGDAAALARWDLTHLGFEIDYAPGRKRGATRNTVAWTGEDGQPRQAVIGDHRPLVLQGHRFYTSPNKGYAPVLRWWPDAAEPVQGAVHLPSFPAHELRQSREWSLPGGPVVWVMLAVDETLIDPGRPARFALPERPRLIVRSGEQRAELRPGENVWLPGGRLEFVALRTWMGYRVAHDPSLPWLLAAALVAALALALHYLQQFGWWPRATGEGEASPASSSAEVRHG